MAKKAAPKKAPKGKGGRPSPYAKVNLEQVEKLCLLGATDDDLAEFYSVSRTTVNNWKNEHPEFLDTIKRGKEMADAEIANSLYHRAKGYSHPEVKVFQSDGAIITHDVIKHYPPDTAAAFIWLKNRQPGKWRDKKEIENTNIDKNIPDTLEEIEKELEELRGKTEGESATEG